MLIFRGRDLTTFVAHWEGAPVFGVRVRSAFEWIPFSIFGRRPVARIQGAIRSQVPANSLKGAGFREAVIILRWIPGAVRGNNVKRDICATSPLGCKVSKPEYALYRAPVHLRSVSLPRVESGPTRILGLIK